MKKSWALLLGAVVVGFMAPVQAEDCVLHVKRIACTGQDAESYKKCDGKQECDEMKPAADEAACTHAAHAACANSRTDITKFKVIHAKFKGKDLAGGFNADGVVDPAGLNFCNAAAPDLNKCN